MKSKYDIFTKKELTDFLDGCENDFNNIFWNTPMEAMLDKKMDELLKRTRGMIPLENDSIDEARKNLLSGNSLIMNMRSFSNLDLERKLERVQNENKY